MCILLREEPNGFCTPKCSMETIFFSCSADQLRKLIRECVKLELQEHYPPKESINAGFISRKEAATILRISLVSLGTYAKMGLIPSYRLGNRVLFKEHEVLTSVLQVKTFRKGGFDK